MKLGEGDSESFGIVYGSVSVPISDWWGGSHELKHREIKEKIAENELEDNSELLLVQMEKAWRDLTDAYTEYLLNEESKAQAQENLSVNEDGYENGLITVSDLLEAQALLKEAEDRLTDSKSQFLIAKTEYLQVTGRFNSNHYKNQ
jgi:outer membrane protein TolC